MKRVKHCLQNEGEGGNRRVKRETGRHRESEHIIKTLLESAWLEKPNL